MQGAFPEVIADVALSDDHDYVEFVRVVSTVDDAGHARKAPTEARFLV
jgi:hypothetical protein